MFSVLCHIRPIISISKKSNIAILDIRCFAMRMDRAYLLLLYYCTYIIVLLYLYYCIVLIFFLVGRKFMKQSMKMRLLDGWTQGTGVGKVREGLAALLRSSVE